MFRLLSTLVKIGIASLITGVILAKLNLSAEQILAELGIHDMILLTNTHHSLVALEGYGINIVGERPID